MALINCSECGKQISDKAYTCPHCGAPLDQSSKTAKPKKRKKKWLIILIVLVIFALIGKMSESGSTGNNEATSEQKTEKTTEQKNITKKTETTKVETPIWQKFDLTEEQWTSFKSIFDKVGFTEITKVEKEDTLNNGVVSYYVEMKGIEPNKVISPGRTTGNIIYVYITPEKKLNEISVNFYPVYEKGKVLQNIRAYTEISVSEQVDYMYMAKDAVKQLLKAPSTAKFCKDYEYKFSKEKGIVATYGFVDSQNSFGAKIRSNFVLKYDCVAKKAISIEIDGQVFTFK
ncbi:MAG: zinc ribbon domain-containing protein [Spirochaetia bacterium]|nr:zinc ribbon domain-containing protein [Spirochaetia bacterium]